MGYQRVSFFYYKSKFEESSAKEIMDIGDKELIQLLRKNSNSQVKPTILEVLQQKIGDVTIH